MPGANLVFHIGSALLIGALIYQMLRFKKQRDFLRRAINAIPTAPHVTVDTPLHFLRNYCDALNLRFDDTTLTWPKTWNELQKIKYADLLKVHRQMHLREIKPQRHGADQVQLALCGQAPTQLNQNESPNSLDFGFAQVQVSYS